MNEYMESLEKHVEFLKDENEYLLQKIDELEAQLDEISQSYEDEIEELLTLQNRYDYIICPNCGEKL